MPRQFKPIALALSALLFLALALFQPSSALAYPPACDQNYTVQKGDWLSTIAQKLLGDPNAYIAIYAATKAAARVDPSYANPTDPNTIEVGMKLCIPTPTAPAQGPGPVIPSAAGIYTSVGPAADASGLVETLILTQDFKATYISDYIGKARITDTGTWTTKDFNYVVTLTEMDGKPMTAQVMTFQLKDGNLVTVGDQPTTYTKTSADVVALSGLYTTTMSVNGANETIALTLLPNGQATLNITPDGKATTTEFGTWTASGKTATVNFTTKDGAPVTDNFVFELQGDKLVATTYNKETWANGLTLTKYNAPSQPETPATASVPGTYVSSGPAADASALITTLVLGTDGKAGMTSNYVGKAVSVETGTWTQDGLTANVSFTEQDGKPETNNITFERDGEKLTATQGGSGIVLYAATANVTGTVSYLQRIALPDNAIVNVYLTDVSKADAPAEYISAQTFPSAGKQVPLPFTVPYAPSQIQDNHTYTIQVNIVVNDALAWTTTTAYPVITRGAPTENVAVLVEQVPAPAPAATATPQASSSLEGRYTAQLPAADAVGRVIVLNLLQDNKADMLTQFIGKGEPITATGTWKQDGDKAAVSLDSPGGKEELVFLSKDGTLVLLDPEKAGYGSNGLTLTKTPSGQTISADYGGVSIAFDAQLAKSAQGETLKAIPVTEGPALGGASPAAVRFTFDGEKMPDYFAPNLPQVLVYKTDDCVKLDPSTKQTVEDLQAMLKNKPTDFSKGIPVLPPIGAQQVIRVQPQYVDFKNGTGISFITYYAQDASPIGADRIFVAFQGLTNDGKYYVAAFYPVTTALLPADPNTALQGKSYEEWAKGYDKYLSDLVASLNGLSPAAYTPDLTLVGGLLKSINVSNATLEAQ